MSFVGVRLSRKGRILFYWVVIHTLKRTIQYRTVLQLLVVVIIYDNTFNPIFTPDPCDYLRGLAVL